MDKSFYQKEAASLQSLYEKFNEIQFTSDEDELETSGRLSKDMIIVAIVLLLLVVSMVGFLTMWLVN